jgi:hypothetical protein
VNHALLEQCLVVQIYLAIVVEIEAGFGNTAVVIGYEKVTLQIIAVSGSILVDISMQCRAIADTVAVRLTVAKHLTCTIGKGRAAGYELYVRIGA